MSAAAEAALHRVSLPSQQHQQDQRHSVYRPRPRPSTRHRAPRRAATQCAPGVGVAECRSGFAARERCRCCCCCCIGRVEVEASGCRAVAPSRCRLPQLGEGARKGERERRTQAARIERERERLATSVSGRCGIATRRAPCTPRPRIQFFPLAPAVRARRAGRRAGGRAGRQTGTRQEGEELARRVTGAHGARAGAEPRT